MKPPLPPLAVRDLGRADYAETLALQHALVAKRKAGAIPDTLVLVEHPSVITLGRRKDAPAHVLMPGETPVVQVERGGDVTWHGPGQLVGYPIIMLAEHERDVHRVLRRLEEAFITLCASAFPTIRAFTRPGHTGVWASSSASPGDAERKIVSLGIAISGWVTFHGFALNVDCDLDEFTRIQPCGMEARVMGSLASLGAEIPPRAELAARVAAEVAGALERTLV